ncbi:Ctr copper transporter [Thelephora ganbajun]|uniref:Ctr copper transporter n=1 Tax=Thelephora ganbajun TaxID=370292 RepID=A0ACB6ZDK3_THEGA|nr:Ctr copper transporter [Thelephora ganbajun]
MDHSHHDHGMHMSDPPEARCRMSMLWNTRIIDTCVVFKSWHIRSNAGFVVSCIAIVLLGLFFEWLRSYAKRVDQKILAKEGKGRVRLGSSRDGSRERGEDAPKFSTISRASRVYRSLLYAVIVFISFFLMLVFMTYNAYLILATVAGAGIGHYLFSEFGMGGDDKGMACH